VSFDALFVFALTFFILGLVLAAIKDKYGDK